MCISAKLSWVVLGGVLVVTVWTSQATGQGKDVGAVNRGTLNAPNVNQANDISELKRQVKAALAHMDELQNKLDTGKVEGDFRQQLNDERARLVAIENRIDELELTSAVKNMQTKIGRGAEATPGITSGLAPADIYNDGFFVSTADKSFSLYLNGLFQIRYTGFSPQENVVISAGAPSPRRTSTYTSDASPHQGQSSAQRLNTSCSFREPPLATETASRCSIASPPKPYRST